MKRIGDLKTSDSSELDSAVILRYSEGSRLKCRANSVNGDPSVAAGLHQDDDAAGSHSIGKIAIAWLACAVFFLTSVVARAQPLVDRIPQDAVIYIGWSGSESMGAGYDASHLKAVVEASNIKQLFDESIPRLLENLGHQDEDAAMVMSIISTIGGPMWRHPSAIYFGGADVNNPDFPMPKLAFICDAGKEGKELAAQIDKLITSHGQPPIPYKAEEHDGLVVIAFGNTEVSATKKPAVPLSARKEFKAAMAQVGKDPVVAAYIDVEGGIDQIDQVVTNFAPPQAKQKWGTIRDAIGLRSLKRIAWTGGFDGKEWSNQALVEAPEPRAGLVKALLDAKPLSDATLKAIPKSATMAAAGHFDAGGLLGAIREMVKKIDADASGEFEQGLDEVKQAIGMDLQTDILDTLGDEWALYSDPNVGGNGMLGFTVVNHLKDSAKAEKAFTQLEQLLNGMLKEHMAGAPVSITFNTTHQGDLTIHYLGIPVIAPSWAIKDGNLYVGLYPQVVSGAADHVASKGKSILENEDFMALRKRLGESGEISAISYSDLPRTAAEGYQEVLMLSRVYLGLADLFGAKTPALALPTLSKLLPHVTPAASVAWVDKAGWHSRQISPFPGSEILNSGGMGSIMAAQQAIFLGAALPSLNRSQRAATRVKDATNLRQIGQAMMIYANGNKGMFPTTPGELFLTQDLNIDIFINPEMHVAPVGNNKEELAQWINTSSGYTYLAAGKKDPAGPEVILAHDKIRPGAEGISLLFGDGHVEWMPLGSAQALINKQLQADAAKAPKAGQ